MFLRHGGFSFTRSVDVLRSFALKSSLSRNLTGELSNTVSAPHNATQLSSTLPLSGTRRYVSSSSAGFRAAYCPSRLHSTQSSLDPTQSSTIEPTPPAPKIVPVPTVCPTEVKRLPPNVSFYRRRLPDSVTHLNSPQGRVLFTEALRDGTMELYFPLSEQFMTQAEPAYCALSTLAMCMNAMSIDPGVVWRWPWRWAHEDVLCSCLDRAPVRNEGVTFAQFSQLATCHGLAVQTHYARDSSMESFRAAVASLSAEPTTVASGLASDSVLGPNGGPEHAEPPVDAPPSHSYAFREHNTNTSASASDPDSRGGLRRCIAVSFSRKTLGQTGDGHVSPIGGYHAASDSVLIMDVARFKYPPYWVPLPLLWESMLPLDKATGTSRGWAVLAPGTGGSRAVAEADECPRPGIRIVEVKVEGKEGKCK